MKRGAIAAAALLLLLFTSAQAEDVDLLPARFGKFACVGDKADRNICNGIERYEFADNGGITVHNEVPLRIIALWTMKITSRATLENGQLCSKLSVDEAKNAEMWVGGKKAPYEAYKPFWQQLQDELFGPLIGKRVCTRHETRDGSSRLQRQSMERPIRSWPRRSSSG